MTPMDSRSIDRKSSCGFKSVVKIGDQQWEWCSLYHAEITELDCEKCEYRELYQEPPEFHRETTRQEFII